MPNSVCLHLDAYIQNSSHVFASGIILSDVRKPVLNVGTYVNKFALFSVWKCGML